MQDRELVVELRVARLDADIGGIEGVLDVLETTQHVARHVERHHGEEDDIHQVYHLLSRREAGVGCRHLRKKIDN